MSDENNTEHDLDDFDKAFADALASDDIPQDEVIQPDDPAEFVDKLDDAPEDKPNESESSVEVQPKEETPIVPEDTKLEESDSSVSANTSEVKTVDIQPDNKQEVQIPAPNVAPAPKVEQQVEDEFPDPVLSDEHQTALKKFREEWPDVAEAQDLIMKHNVALIEAQHARALQATIKQIYEHVDPALAMAHKSAHLTFKETIVTAHSDFEKVAPQLKPWIDKQPGYLQKGMLEVYNSGTAEEIIDLVKRFKDANDVKPEVPNSQPTVSTNVKSKADSLAPVAPGRRPAVSTKGSDPNDFDSAFDEACESDRNG